MRTFAIGDIHGCLSALETLLDFLNMRPDDRLVFLGDYVDRGPNSRGVIELLMRLSQNPTHQFVRGNHDQWMLQARLDEEWRQSWGMVGGLETLESYDATTLDDIPNSHFEWLEKTPLFFQTETHIFVHGAIGQKPPEKTGETWLLWRRISDMTSPHPSGKRVICGHTAQKKGVPLNRGHAVCIDTHCYGGGWLSALNIDSNQVFQADEWNQTRQFEL